MKAKNVIIRFRGKEVPMNSLSNNEKCKLILGLLMERDNLKKQLLDHTSPAEADAPELDDK